MANDNLVYSDTKSVPKEMQGAKLHTNANTDIAISSIFKSIEEFGRNFEEVRSYLEDPSIRNLKGKESVGRTDLLKVLHGTSVTQVINDDIRQMYERLTESSVSLRVQLEQLENVLFDMKIFTTNALVDLDTLNNKIIS